MNFFGKSSSNTEKEGEVLASPSLSVQTLVSRGNSTEHKDFCHDFLIHHETEQFFVGAILDGSSGGVHSQFASALFGKVFNLLLRVQGRLDRVMGIREPRDIARSLMHEFCEHLAIIKHELGLANNEVLSTILLAIYSKPRNKLCVVAMGDGYIHVNGNGIKLENTRYGDTMVDGILFKGENKPDYLIDDIDRIMGRYVEYSLGPSTHPDDETDSDRQDFSDMLNEQRELFNEWFNEKPFYEFDDVREFSITSDGIFTFRSDGIIDITDVAIDFLLNNADPIYGGKSQEALRKKVNKLSFTKRNSNDVDPHKLRAVHQDDLSIIRVTVNMS